MAETAAPRKRAPARAPKRIVTPKDVLEVANDVSTNVLVERAQEMRTIILGVLAGVNVNMLGPGGTAKSLGLREFAKRITGAKYFEKAVHPMMPADAVIGGYDMERFAKEGVFARKIEGYLPDAHIGFVDEITRANGPTQDALLPLFNTEERNYEHNGGMKRSNLRCFLTGANFMPDPEDPRAGAFIDRFTLMLQVDYVKSDESFQEMLERHHARRLREAGLSADKYKPTTMSLDQLDAAQAEVNLVALTADFKEKYAEVRRKCREEGLTVSDRRWMELGRVSRASAWLAGRDFLIPEDIAAVEQGLWRDVDDIPIAHKLVLPFHGRFEREARNKQQEAAEPLAEWQAIKPLVEGTPPNKDLEQSLLTRAINTSRKIKDVKGRVDKLLKEAEREKKDAAGLRDLGNELAGVLKWFEETTCPTDVRSLTHDLRGRTWRVLAAPR
jgi:MoxR-like ATPase